MTKLNLELPVEFPVGIWEDIIYEKNSKLVYIYSSSAKDKQELESLLSLLNADKKSVIKYMRETSMPFIDEMSRRDIICVFRYYNQFNRKLLLETVIKPTDW